MITAQTSGWAELGHKLRELDAALQTDIMRKAGREAMQVVQEDMRAHAGYDKKSKTAHLRDNITLRTAKSTVFEGGIMITVGPSKAHRMKALAQEMGTLKQVAKPFIRPALDYNQQTVLKVLAQEIRAALNVYSK
jgi:HK97 gp10 family phage protein